MNFYAECQCGNCKLVASGGVSEVTLGEYLDWISLEPLTWDEDNPVVKFHHCSVCKGQHPN